MARIADTALLLAIVSFTLSSAAFTPMVFVSWVAAVLGVAAVGLGYFRRGLITIYFALGATVVSPIFMENGVVDSLLIAIPIVGALIGCVAYWNYRQSGKSG
jgi:hypothetical protein